MWIWVLGILNIFELITQAIIFYDIVNIIIGSASGRSKSGCLPYIYFILFPLVEFVGCGILFIWCLKPTFNMGVYSMMFSIANLLKGLVLGVVFLILLPNSATENEQMGVFLLISLILLFIMAILQRYFLWTCRNSI
mgnify:CR=1 FL=1